MTAKAQKLAALRNKLMYANVENAEIFATVQNALSKNKQTKTKNRI